eukprot:COSAG01_NODE_12378_length_1750_cov_6.127196_1_plen_113_part_10
MATRPSQRRQRHRHSGRATSSYCPTPCHGRCLTRPHPPWPRRMDTHKQIEKLRRKLEAAEQHRRGCTDDARRQRIAASMTQLRERLARLEKCIQAGGSSATAGSDGEAVGASQ